MLNIFCSSKKLSANRTCLWNIRLRCLTECVCPTNERSQLWQWTVVYGLSMILSKDVFYFLLQCKTNSLGNIAGDPHSWNYISQALSGTFPPFWSVPLVHVNRTQGSNLNIQFFTRPAGIYGNHSMKNVKFNNDLLVKICLYFVTKNCGMLELHFRRLFFFVLCPY